MNSSSQSQLPEEYVDINLIGSGGFGTVYGATNSATLRQEAIKLLMMPGGTDFGRQVERLRREAAAVSALNHPNIVRVYRFGLAPSGIPFIAYEFLAGRTLQEYLRDNASIDLGLFHKLSTQLLSGLQEAHNNGIIHRDIKPSNLMLVNEANSDLCLKIVDFGIAKSTAPAQGQKETLTQEGSILGSPEYMSPEQCSGAPLDYRSDIYSAACVMYEMLAGRVPFCGDAPLHTLYKQINETPQPIDGVSVNLSDLILQALSKEPGDRPPSCLEFLSRLHSVMQGAELTRARPAYLQSRGNYWLYALLAVALLGISVFAFLKLNSIKQTRDKPEITIPQMIQMSRSIKAPSTPDDRGLEPIWATLEAGRPGKLHEESVPGVDTNKFVYHVTRGHVLYSAASGARVFTGHKFLNRSLPELRKQAEQEFALAVAAVTPPGHSPAVNAAPSLAWITFLRTDGKDFKGAWEAGTLARLLYLHRNDKEAVTLSMPQDIADLEVSPEDDVRLATWTALAGRNLKQKEAGRVAEEGWRCGLKYKPYEMMTTLAGTEAVKCYLAVEDKKNAQRLLDEINKHEIDCPLHKVDNNSCVEVAQTNFQLGDPQMAVAVIKSGFDKLSKRQPVRTNDMQALAQLAAVYLASTNHAEADRWRKIADRLK